MTLVAQASLFQSSLEYSPGIICRGYGPVNYCKTKKKKKKKDECATPEIPAWSPTAVLAWRSEAYVDIYGRADGMPRFLQSMVADDT